MARKAYGYPDDPSAPIGTNEWNADPDATGMLGFTTETIASATSVTPTNSMISLTGSTDVATISQSNTNDGDIMYITTTGSVTLKHNTGNIQLTSQADTDLETTSPLLLIRKGAS